MTIAAGGISAISSCRSSPRDPERHVILVTATPHSGNEAAFRSLLGMLHADFANLPEDLAGQRERAAPAPSGGAFRAASPR